MYAAEKVVPIATVARIGKEIKLSAENLSDVVYKANDGWPEHNQVKLPAPQKPKIGQLESQLTASAARKTAKQSSARQSPVRRKKTGRPLVRSQAELRAEKERGVADRQDRQRRDASSALNSKMVYGFGASLVDATEERILGKLRNAAPAERRESMVLRLLTDKTLVDENKYMLRPDSSRRLGWSLLVTLLLLYVGVVTPYRIGFKQQAKGAAYTFELVIDCLFLVDVIINFRTGIHDEDGKVRLEPLVVAKSYLKGWFWVDMISSIPFGSIDPGPTSSLSRMTKVLKILRLSKLTKLLKVNAIFEAVEDAFMAFRNYFKFLKIVLFACVLTHLNACVSRRSLMCFARNRPASFETRASVVQERTTSSYCRAKTNHEFVRDTRIGMGVCR